MAGTGKMPPRAPETRSPEPESLPGPAVTDCTPEARRKAASDWRHGLHRKMRRHIGLQARAATVLGRVVAGTWKEGSIHAGNLAYMSLMAIFPFFILGAGGLALLGDVGASAASLTTLLTGLPPTVRQVIEPVVNISMAQASGWLLWAGGLVGLWTVGSLIETLRDILRRAYGTEATLGFWHARLISSSMIVAAMILLIVSFYTHIAIVTAHGVVETLFPQFARSLGEMLLTGLLPALGLFVAVLLLFMSLTPAAYRGRRYPKWPGALTFTVWSVAVAAAIPQLLRIMFTYDLIYGSLAGIMIVLFFFWLVGLGMVVSAELNAALAVSPEEERALLAITGDDIEDMKDRQT